MFKKIILISFVVGSVAIFASEVGPHSSASNIVAARNNAALLKFLAPMTLREQPDNQPPVQRPDNFICTSLDNKVTVYSGLRTEERAYNRTDGILRYEK